MLKAAIRVSECVDSAHSRTEKANEMTKWSVSFECKFAAAYNEFRIERQFAVFILLW